MLGNTGFDLWADGYDVSVGLSDENDSYPFAGYKRVLGSIYEMVMARGKPTVLDLGFGTATLTARLYEQGCEIWGQDFSDRMIALAREKMPKAHLFKGDFNEGLRAELKLEHYDFIVATYALHHLDDAQKVAFIKTLLPLLKKDGAILMGDVAFPNREEHERCRAIAGEEWDDEEFYFVYDELHRHFPQMTFERISHCAGVLRVGN
ncbi:MAG: class I SAM-dependent methyltransferase [Clostridia bacterium]|nr:class I SAM-dependent methyltransferase [Clostridia bacterium]